MFISPRWIRAFSCAFSFAYASAYLTSVNQAPKKRPLLSTSFYADVAYSSAVCDNENHPRRKQQY